MPVTRHQTSTSQTQFHLNFTAALWGRGSNSHSASEELDSGERTWSAQGQRLACFPGMKAHLLPTQPPLYPWTVCMPPGPVIIQRYSMPKWFNANNNHFPSTEVFAVFPALSHLLSCASYETGSHPPCYLLFSQAWQVQDVINTLNKETFSLS